MAFYFPLATVLRVRQIVEEREASLLRRILSEIEKTIDLINKSDVEGVRANASRRTDVLKSFRGSAIHAAYGEVEAIKLKKQEHKAKLERLEELRDKQLIVYRTARRNREMLADMQVKKRRIYESQETRHEQSAIDDNYAARRARR